jgi:Na+/proline symporter
MLLYPGLANPEEGYVRVMVGHLPPFWRGLLLASLFAAFMSTISTHLNWGASYLVSDVYRRHLRPTAPDAHYAAVGRATTVGLMLIAGVITYYLKSVEGAWKFLLAVGAGTGLVYLLRWYWWRINAWSEVSAMGAAFALSMLLQWGVGLDPDRPREFAWLMLLTVGGTTAVWLVVTYATPPEPVEHLRRFYARARPGGLGWEAVVGRTPGEGPGWSGLWRWALGCAVVYLGLFGTGQLFLGQPWRGWLLLAVAVGLTAWIVGRAEHRPTEPSGVC